MRMCYDQAPCPETDDVKCSECFELQERQMLERLSQGPFSPDAVSAGFPGDGVQGKPCTVDPTLTCPGDKACGLLYYNCEDYPSGWYPKCL